MTAISLGMPEAPAAGARAPPQDPPDPGRQGRRRQRPPDLGAVDDDHAHLRRQRHAPADRRAHGHRLRHRARGLPVPGRRRRAARDRPALADPGHRRHPLPAQVRLRGDRRRLRRRPREPGQHPQVRRPGQGDRRRGQGPRHLDPDRRQRRHLDPRMLEKYGKATPEALVESRGVGGRALRGARLPRLQDLGQAQRPGRDGPRLRAARRGRRLAAAPRRHRGRAGVPGHHQVVGGLRRPAQRRGSATPSASPCPRRRSRRSRSASRSWSRSTSSRAGSRSSPAPRAAAPRSTSTSWPRR